MLSTRSARKENEISSDLGKMKLNDENMVSFCFFIIFIYLPVCFIRHFCQGGGGGGGGGGGWTNHRVFHL